MGSIEFRVVPVIRTLFSHFGVVLAVIDLPEYLVGIGPDVPLRLSDAVRVAFPAGGMTVAGLRKERDKGRLEIERIANKEFTTLSAIERMRELCLVKPKAPSPVTRMTNSTSTSPDHAQASAAKDAALAFVRRLVEGAGSGSQMSTGRRRKTT